ncbi:hypothetical protein [Actinomadura rupiterrae]|uniref:hypothetical protein n=1 Tax=Actinomadura rupiterrae TaxID=559627 RepID=UPI0020A51FB4|nr:hypothetical protein [Actinomadura rupiterrae]MCP2341028.1 hypothetical protein [Actinomadura rupiterrae]
MQFHYVITVECPIATGSRQATLSGLYNSSSSDTRESVFKTVLDHVRGQLGMTATANILVMFFSLESNELPRSLKAVG